MKILAISLITVLSGFASALFVLYIKSRRPLRSAAINAVLGITAIIAVNLTCRFTGVRIPVNIYTVPGAAIFGIPAAAAIIIFQTLF